MDSALKRDRISEAEGCGGGRVSDSGGKVDNGMRTLFCFSMLSLKPQAIVMKTIERVPD